MHLHRYRAILSLLIFLVACTGNPTPTPTLDEQAALSVYTGPEEDIASIKVSPDSIIATTAQTYVIEAVYLDAEDDVLGLVDPSKVNLNISGEGYNADFNDAGSLDFSVPAEISTGHLGVSLKSNKQIYGVVGASVVATKTGVTALPDADVIFPRTDYDFTGMTGEEIGAYLFDPFTEAEFAQTVSDNLDEAPLFPVVLEGTTSLQAGDLITGTGGAFFYGRVERQVAQRGGRTLLAVRAVLPTEVYDDFAEVGVEDMQTSNVLPQEFNLELELSDLPPEESISTQSSFGCGFETFKVTANVDAEVKLDGSPIVAEAELSITGLGEGSFNCKFTGEYPIPITGPFSAIILPQLKTTGKGTLEVTADSGEFAPNTLIKVSEKAQLYPKIERLESTPAIFEFDPGPRDNWNDVNGDDGYVRGSATLQNRVGVEFVVVGAVDKALDLADKGGIAARFAGIVKTIRQYSQGAAIFAFIGMEPKLTAQWATMKSALNDASSKAYSKMTANGGIQASDGWIIKALKSVWANLDLSTSFDIVAMEREFLFGPLAASVLADDGEGNANISVTNNGEFPLTKVQLGNPSENSLHGDVTAPEGGAVTYDKTECKGADSLDAKVLAIADTPFFPIGAPFNSQQVVNVCLEDDNELKSSRLTKIGVGSSAPSGRSSYAREDGGRNCFSWNTAGAKYADSKTVIVEGSRFESNHYPCPSPLDKSSEEATAHLNAAHQSFIPAVVSYYEENKLSEKQCIRDPYKKEGNPWYYATIETYSKPATCN